MKKKTEYKLTKDQQQQLTVIRKQADQYGGFCGNCGEALEPILQNDIIPFDPCPFNGKHLAKSNIGNIYENPDLLNPKGETV